VNESTAALETVDAEVIQLGTLNTTGPQALVARASEIATVLADLIKQRKLYTTISGKAYVRVEGWSTLGAMLGVVPREVSVERNIYEDAHGIMVEDYEATVELVRVTDGAVIGRGSALVSTDESRWRGRDRYARRSMAITRATGKAFRLSFSWIMALAGYEPTPAEEMSFDRPAATNGNGHAATNGRTEPKGPKDYTGYYGAARVAGLDTAAAKAILDESGMDAMQAFAALAKNQPPE